MSIVGYLTADRLKRKRTPEQAAEERGGLSVRTDAEDLPGGLVRVAYKGEFYEDVEDYDPVLRSHCRL